MTALRWRWLLGLVASAVVVLGLAGAAPGQPQESGTGCAAHLLPAPVGFTAAEPRAVNNHGVVVGVADGRPVKWVDGRVSLLPMPEGFTGAAAQSVNDRGVVAGVGTPGPDRYPVPIVWHRDGNIQTLPVLEHFHSAGGVLVNDRGDLFGTLSNDWYESVAVVWRRGVPELLPAPPPFTATGVRAVNNQGVALGSYGDPEWTWWVTWRGDTIIPLPSPTASRSTPGRSTTVAWSSAGRTSPRA